MSLRIQSNPEAMNAHRQLIGTSEKLQKSMERLSSGYRINRAADDAAGLAISEKLRGQISGISQAMRNTQDAVSLVQTAEGALHEVHSMLQRMRELAVQYKNGTLSPSDQQAIQSEVSQLQLEVDRIGNQVQFNGVPLLASAGTITFQVGAMDNQVITVSTVSLGSTISSAAYALTPTGASDIAEIDVAINNVSATRAQFGAVQNRLDHTLANLGAYHENLVASESRVRDADMAEEMVNFTKLQILQQAGTSMLAQANQVPQNVLTLLRG
jgi:flagellin